MTPYEVETLEHLVVLIELAEAIRYYSACSALACGMILGFHAWRMLTIAKSQKKIW